MYTVCTRHYTDCTFWYYFNIVIGSCTVHFQERMIITWLQTPIINWIRIFCSLTSKLWICNPISLNQKETPEASAPFCHTHGPTCLFFFFEKLPTCLLPARLACPPSWGRVLIAAFLILILLFGPFLFPWAGPCVGRACALFCSVPVAAAGPTPAHRSRN